MESNDIGGEDKELKEPDEGGEATVAGPDDHDEQEGAAEGGEHEGHDEIVPPERGE